MDPTAILFVVPVPTNLKVSLDTPIWYDPSIFVVVVETPVMFIKSKLLKLWGALVSTIYWFFNLEGISSELLSLIVLLVIDSTDFPFSKETLAAAPFPVVNLLSKFIISPILYKSPSVFILISCMLPKLEEETTADSSEVLGRGIYLYSNFLSLKL